MKNLFFIITLISMSCTQSSTEYMKYDFYHDSGINTKGSFSSVVTEYIQDTVFNYYFYGLDSNFVINDISNYDHLTKEYYDHNSYFLYGVLKLKIDAFKGEEWKTQYDIGYFDSLTVKVLDIYFDTIIYEFNTSKCYLLDFNYDKRTAGEDFLDFRIYFDTNRKIAIKKEYYFDDRLKGYELLVNEHTINTPVKPRLSD